MRWKNKNPGVLFNKGTSLEFVYVMEYVSHFEHPVYSQIPIKASIFSYADLIFIIKIGSNEINLSQDQPIYEKSKYLVFHNIQVQEICNCVM